MKQILRKFLKKTIEPSGTCEGSIETITNQRIEKELLTKDELEELNSMFGDDYDSAFTEYGLLYGWNEELCSIGLDALAEGLASFLERNPEEEYETLKEIAKKIEPWRAYDLEFENEPVKP